MPTLIVATAAHSVSSDGTPEWSKSPDVLVQGASTVKTLTCWVARQIVTDMTAPVTLLERDMLWAEPLLLGDTLSLGDVIHASMMGSVNCAAEAVARVAGEALLAAEGGTGDPRARFLTEAAARAASILGWAGHRINDPAGNNADNRMTARQLVALLHHIRTDDPWLYDAMSKTSKVIPVTGARTANVTINHTIGAVLRASTFPEFVAGKTGTQGNGPDAPRYLLWSWLDPHGETHTSVIAASDGPNRDADVRAVMDQVIATLPPVEQPEPPEDASLGVFLSFFLSGTP